MSILLNLDELLTKIATILVTTSPADSTKAMLAARYTPDGSVSAHDFCYQRCDHSLDDVSLPPAAVRSNLIDLTERHWRLTQDLGQPRWYKMTVTVERSGKFNVDFEYKDDYKVGDIMQRG